MHAELLKALSHPKRLEIIHLLRDQKMHVGKIQEMLGLPQANLSQHLQVLRESKVVEAHKNGKHVSYRLAHKNFIKASDLLREVLIQKNKDVDEFSAKMSDLVPLVHDPVCTMRLSPKTAGFAYKFKGKRYYFCASGCLEKFKKKPEKYTEDV